MQLHSPSSHVPFVPTSNQMQVFLQQEKQAQTCFLNMLTVKESIGQNFEYASARSLGAHWPKFKEATALPVNYYSSINETVTNFIEFLITKKKDVHDLRKNTLFISEVTEFVALKITHDNVKSRSDIFCSSELLQQASLLVLMPETRSKFHEAEGRRFKYAKETLTTEIVGAIDRLIEAQSHLEKEEIFAGIEQIVKDSEARLSEKSREEQRSIMLDIFDTINNSKKPKLEVLKNV